MASVANKLSIYYAANSTESNLAAVKSTLSFIERADIRLNTSLASLFELIIKATGLAICNFALLLD